MAISASQLARGGEVGDFAGLGVGLCAAPSGLCSELAALLGLLALNGGEGALRAAARDRGSGSVCALGPGGGAGRAAKVEERPDSETTPAGNSVVLEEQMIKVAETQTDYQMVTGLYSKSLGLLRTALGPRS